MIVAPKEFGPDGKRRRSEYSKLSRFVCYRLEITVNCLTVGERQNTINILALAGRRERGA
jgi:hypothetical protein